MKFPCIGCLVYTSCSQPCDELFMDNKNIMKRINLGRCPDCGYKIQRITYPKTNLATDYHCLRCDSLFISEILNKIIFSRYRNGITQNMKDYKK